ncbi:MAG: hypothetical protein HY294_11020 [Candidatus Rokubacteria bacterium]|nr:hypothetical protein [Candidatus Rokubacteria bacterium]
MTAARRLEISVCPRERGTVVLPVRRGGRAERLDARRVAAELGRLIAERHLEPVVRVREACAGGCSAAGPNVSVSILAPVVAGERPDSIAIGWKTYVYSLATLDCLAAVIEDNLAPPREAARRRRSRAR